MYKTVRHGENSLQYTILPQTEEVLNNSGLKGKGRDYSPSIHIRRSRRRSTLKYVLLIVFGIIAALALSSVPLYVMNGALYARRNLQDKHEVITASSMLATGRDMIKSRKKELELAPEISSSLLPILNPSTKTIMPTTTFTTTVPTTLPNEIATTPSWPMPALKPWKSLIASTTMKPIPTENMGEIPLVGTPSGSVRLLDNYMSLKPWDKDVIIKPTVTPEPAGLRNLLKYYSHPTINVPAERLVTTNINNKLSNDVLITTKATMTRTAVSTEYELSNDSKMRDLKDTILSVDDDEEFKESLEVDEVFSLPPLKPDPGTSASDSDEVTVSKTSGEWYGARWPFVDTSSYFQWTGYSPGDNLLLPLLVAALSSVCLVLLLALAVKRRRSTNTASAQIGKLTADLQADDNTNLLTAENPEETEE